jgi:hypothetical protein
VAGLAARQDRVTCAHAFHLDRTPGAAGGAAVAAGGRLAGFVAGRALGGQAGRPGWVVVWACFVALGVIFGVAYSFAAFFEPLQQQFQARRADVSLMFGLSGLLYFTLGAGAGMLADRFGPRPGHQRRHAVHRRRAAGLQLRAGPGPGDRWPTAWAWAWASAGLHPGHRLRAALVHAAARAGRRAGQCRHRRRHAGGAAARGGPAGGDGLARRAARAGRWAWRCWAWRPRWQLRRAPQATAPPAAWWPARR